MKNAEQATQGDRVSKAIAWAQLKADGSVRSISWSAPSAESLEIAAIENEPWHPLYLKAGQPHLTGAEMNYVHAEPLIWLL